MSRRVARENRSSRSTFGWNVPGTVREQPLLPVRPQNCDLPVPTRSPCDLCLADPATASSSPTSPSCKIWESSIPQVRLSPPCHTNRLQFKASVLWRGPGRLPERRVEVGHRQRGQNRMPGAWAKAEDMSMAHPLGSLSTCLGGWAGAKLGADNFECTLRGSPHLEDIGGE